MRSDIDKLMEARGLDAMVVQGQVQHNPALYYLLLGVPLTHATVIKRRGREPILIHSPIERDEAAQTGMEMHPTHRWHILKYLQDQHGDLLAAHVAQMLDIFRDMEVNGRVGIYGVGNIGAVYAFWQALNEAWSDGEIIGEFSKSVLEAAREIKEPVEIERLRSVAQATCTVVGEVRDFLQSHAVRNDTLITNFGEPLTVAQVKQFMQERLHAYGLDDNMNTIFAIGPSAGVPHNRGEPGSLVQLGQSIVFDIFPQERGGGYFHDMTRTWCLGYAPPEVEAAYNDVMDALRLVEEKIAAGVSGRSLQTAVFDLFEARGHVTTRSKPDTQEGAVHSLGHGIGLAVHEAPWLRDQPGSDDVLQPGMVFTVEPGLYYPERGFGIRVENSYYGDSDGSFHRLTDFPHGLVLQVG